MSASRKPRKRHHGARVPRPVSAPMLINRGLINDDIETREVMFVLAFAGGWATIEHYNNIADMRDVLLLAAAKKRDAETIGMCRAVGVALMNIKDRFTETGKMGVTGDEHRVLREFASLYRDYWMRQSVGAYERACDALTIARQTNTTEIEVTL